MRPKQCKNIPQINLTTTLQKAELGIQMNSSGKQKLFQKPLNLKNGANIMLKD